VSFLGNAKEKAHNSYFEYKFAFNCVKHEGMGVYLTVK